jgi:hypothetical protein
MTDTKNVRNLTAENAFSTGRIMKVLYTFNTSEICLIIFMMLVIP